MIRYVTIGNEVVALQGEVNHGKVTLGNMLVAPVGVWLQMMEKQKTEDHEAIF